MCCVMNEKMEIRVGKLSLVSGVVVVIVPGRVAARSL